MYEVGLESLDQSQKSKSAGYARLMERFSARTISDRSRSHGRGCRWRRRRQARQSHRPLSSCRAQLCNRRTARSSRTRRRLLSPEKCTTCALRCPPNRRPARIGQTPKTDDIHEGNEVHDRPPLAVAKTTEDSRDGRCQGETKNYQVSQGQILIEFMWRPSCQSLAARLLKANAVRAYRCDGDLPPQSSRP